jgi:hypothetical protein
MNMPSNIGLAEDRNLRLRHGVAIFVADPAFDHGRRLQANDYIFHLLPRAQAQQPTFTRAMILRAFQIAGALDKHSVAAWHNIFDLKSSVRSGHGGIVAATTLTFGNQLNNGLFQRLTSRLLYHDPLHEAEVSS